MAPLLPCCWSWACVGVRRSDGYELTKKIKIKIKIACLFKKKDNVD
jgi:hypothetical protein